MFQFSAMGLLALIAFAMCLALSVVIFRAGIPGSAARRLSLLLVVEGVTLFSTGYLDRFRSAELGSVAGLVAAALVVFFLAPLQRFAERVASAAMPNTREKPEYVAFRKMQVYEAAVVEALQEGGISRKEQALLARLRDSLGISESDAAAIEQDLQMQ